jgi:hypothetical protein
MSNEDSVESRWRCMVCFGTCRFALSNEFELNHHLQNVRMKDDARCGEFSSHVDRTSSGDMSNVDPLAKINGTNSAGVITCSRASVFIGWFLKSITRGAWRVLGSACPNIVVL